MELSGADTIAGLDIREKKHLGLSERDFGKVGDAVAEVMLRGGVLPDRAALGFTLVAQGSGVRYDMVFVHMSAARCYVCVFPV